MDDWKAKGYRTIRHRLGISYKPDEQTACIQQGSARDGQHTYAQIHMTAEDFAALITAGAEMIGYFGGPYAIGGNDDSLE